MGPGEYRQRGNSGIQISQAERVGRGRGREEARVEALARAQYCTEYLGYLLYLTTVPTWSLGLLLPSSASSQDFRQIRMFGQV